MPAITLSIIVKNEEKYLRACLESVKNVVDEIILVDTGSTDSTIEIAKEYNAKIFHFDWVNDFSAARNFALKNSSGDWILYLDADERIDKNSAAELKKLSAHKKKIGYYCTVKSIDRIDSRDNSMRYIRFFANETEIEFRGSVHEQIVPSLLENNFKLLHSTILIEHLGYNISQDEKKKKAERNLTLLLKEYSKSKSGYYAYQLANTYNVLEEYDRAKEFYLIAGNSPELAKNLRADSFSSLALIHHKSQNIILAEKYLNESLELNNRQPFSFLLGAKINLLKNRLDIAEEYCKKSYDLNKKSLLLSLESEISSSLDFEEVAYFGLSVALLNKNVSTLKFYLNEVFEFFKKEYPQDFNIRVALMQKLFDGANLLPKEKEIFEKMINKQNLNFLSSLLMRIPDSSYKLFFFSKLHTEYEDNLEITKMLANIIYESGQTEEAIKLLESYGNENDSAMQLYLLSFYLEKGDLSKVKRTFQSLDKNKLLMPEVKQKLELLKSKLPAELFS